MHKSHLMSLLRQENKRLQLDPLPLMAKVLTAQVEALKPDPELAKKFCGALRSRNFNKLLDLADDLDSQKYESSDSHYVARQIAAFVKKYPFPSLANEATSSAWKKFRLYERRCYWMNLLHKRRETKWDPNASVVHRMRSWIRYVISDAPNLPEIWDKCSFGPGASIGVTGDATSFARKLSAETLSVTPSAWEYALAALRSNPQIVEFFACREDDDYILYDDLPHHAEALRQRVKPEYVHHNKITFVPKTARTYRSIAVEPTLNGFVQKGIDEYLRLRLRRVGLDLRDQERNQKMAFLGSREWQSDNPYCTIDLSSASDSIPTELVRRLLPPEWFSFLDSIRAKSYEYDGKVYPYSKFTSMGNGFCFPLQTLIFASIAVAASQELSEPLDFRVYGDDIIVRRSVVQRVLEIIRSMGFVPNTKKTFFSGPFRESCGKDYFGGVDVRPIYLDYALDSVQNIFKFHNSLANSQCASPDVLEILRNAVHPELRFVRHRKGQSDTAFELPMDVFMGSKLPRFNRALWAWRWPELLTQAVVDRGSVAGSGSNMLLLIAALRGSASRIPYAYRRKTALTVRMVSHDADGKPPATHGFVTDHAFVHMISA